MHSCANHAQGSGRADLHSLSEELRTNSVNQVLSALQRGSMQLPAADCMAADSCTTSNHSQVAQVVPVAILLLQHHAGESMSGQRDAKNADPRSRDSHRIGRLVSVGVHRVHWGKDCIQSFLGSFPDLLVQGITLEGVWLSSVMRKLPALTDGERLSELARRPFGEYCRLGKMH